MKVMKRFLMVVAVCVGLTSLADAEDAVRVPITQTAISAYYEFLVPADIAQADETRVWTDPNDSTHTHTEYYATVKVVEAMNVASVASMRLMYFDSEGDLIDAYLRRGHGEASILFAEEEDNTGKIYYTAIAGRTGFIAVDVMRIKKIKK